MLLLEVSLTDLVRMHYPWSAECSYKHVSLLGRTGDWGYINTEYVLVVIFQKYRCNVILSGLGLLEYLFFCEDLGMEPIMAVWAGRHRFPHIPNKSHQVLLLCK